MEAKAALGAEGNQEEGCAGTTPWQERQSVLGKLDGLSSFKPRSGFYFLGGEY